ncbi:MULTISPECIES: YhgE/Pip domain-containing protein [unclassified Rathayibacter]|uniref:YhgE/Pip domain-containing protein n=1 Tax=unclassified Rathayibacter TaxID=2609250 RepID=UPI00188A40E5|nr:MULTISPECIES: YhgE/Pip domain-containing protein [unclassified Rathayibacter]MBF4460941.1 YhgE/Pip domain-containing protein [Rathayibacter sp. VKM Ac-2879]MBF4502352.1 YhgE/Pip domain-containing protein [Rathayibacter sp. VKM Ac-2878]
MALFSLERPRGVKKVSWVTLLGIVLVPLVIGGLLVWALWNPTERLNSITAAVVNEDTPVQINGQTVPLGRQLAAGLVTGGAASSDPTATATPSASPTPVPDVSGSTSTTNFTWVLTDKDDAAKGLADGSYATVVTIPSTFSAAATSYAGDAAKATKATIDIATSEKAKLVDDAISATVTSTATSLLNTQLTTTYLQNLYVGFNTLHDQIGKAADGAGSLADGAQQLGTGASSLADGTSSLANGIGDLATGASSLSGGVAQLGTGASALADGIGQLGSGATSLSGGVSQLATGARASATGATSLQGGASGLADGLDTLAGGVAKLGDSATTASQAASQSAVTTGTALGTIAELAKSCSKETPACALILAEAGKQLDTGNTDGALHQAGVTAAYSAGIAAGITQGADGTPSLVAGTQQSAAGARSLAGSIGQLADGLTQLAAGADGAAGGAAQLATGAGASADGARQLAGGATSAAGGAAALATGASSAADGAKQLAEGAGGVSDGAVQLADGTRSLATGLGSAVAQLPSYTDSESKNLADVVSDPVTNSSDTSDLFGASSVPFFATIALWLGALATFLVLAAFSHRALSSTRSSAALALSSYVPALVIGLVQGLVVAIVMSNVAGLAPGRWIGFALLSMLAGASFAAVNQGLVALLGGVGRFISMVAAVIGLGAGIISTAPGVFDTALDVLPLSAAQNALAGVVEGTGGTGGAVVGLVLWLLFGLLLTVVAIARRRVTSLRALVRTAEA